MLVVLPEIFGWFSSTDNVFYFNLLQKLVTQDTVIHKMSYETRKTQGLRKTIIQLLTTLLVTYTCPCKNFFCTKSKKKIPKSLLNRLKSWANTTSHLPLFKTLRKAGSPYFPPLASFVMHDHQTCLHPNVYCFLICIHSPLMPEGLAIRRSRRLFLPPGALCLIVLDPWDGPRDANNRSSYLKAVHLLFVVMLFIQVFPP